MSKTVEHLTTAAANWVEENNTFPPANYSFFGGIALVSFYPGHAIRDLWFELVVMSTGVIKQIIESHNN